MLLDQALNRWSWLSAIVDPVAETSVVDTKIFVAGIVKADLFDKPAIAWRCALSGYDVIKWPLLGALPSESNCNCHAF